MSRILITPRSLTKGGHPSLQKLTDAGFELVFSTPGKQPDEQELTELVPGCIGYLAGVEKITDRVLDAADCLRVISRNGTGIDNVDLDAARKHNIKVCRAEGANARGVAELAFGLILSLVRDTPNSDKAIKADGWERRLGLELEGRTLGVVGCGKIGKLVTGFALAFGMQVFAYDKFEDASFQPSESFSYKTLDQVVRRSDIITMHCPALPSGEPVLDRAAIDATKPGVFIVNTARAGLVDKVALMDGLVSGHVAGAAFDVHDAEPPVEDKLVKSARVIATPHIGGFTQESVSRAVGVAVDNLITELAG